MQQLLCAGTCCCCCTRTAFGSTTTTTEATTTRSEMRDGRDVLTQPFRDGRDDGHWPLARLCCLGCLRIRSLLGFGCNRCGSLFCPKRFMATLTSNGKPSLSWILALTTLTVSSARTSSVMVLLASATKKICMVVQVGCTVSMVGSGVGGVVSVVLPAISVGVTSRTEQGRCSPVEICSSLQQLLL